MKKLLFIVFAMVVNMSFAQQEEGRVILNRALQSIVENDRQNYTIFDNSGPQTNRNSSFYQYSIRNNNTGRVTNTNVTVIHNNLNNRVDKKKKKESICQPPPPAPTSTKIEYHGPDYSGTKKMFEERMKELGYSQDVIDYFNRY